MKVKQLQTVGVNFVFFTTQPNVRRYKLAVNLYLIATQRNILFHFSFLLHTGR